MTRDEAIEAGARALWARFHNSPETWEEIVDDEWLSVPALRAVAAAVLDAIGWTEPEVAE